VTYTWYGSPSPEYTVVVYSKHIGKSIVNSAGKSIMYNMDGSTPSGFTNSNFCGMNCTTISPSPSPSPSPYPFPSPDPTPGPFTPNTVVDYSTIKIKSL
jgi:hypothetical protein